MYINIFIYLYIYRDSLKINSDSSDDSDTGVIPGFQEVIQANKNLGIEDSEVEAKARSESIVSYLTDPTSLPTNGSLTTQSSESQEDNYISNNKPGKNLIHIEIDKKINTNENMSNITRDPDIHITDSEFSDDISNSTKELTKIKKLLRTSVVNFEVLTEIDDVYLNEDISNSNHSDTNENYNDFVPKVDRNTSASYHKVCYIC
jgi:hypothetical protein